MPCGSIFQVGGARLVTFVLGSCALPVGSRASGVGLVWLALERRIFGLVLLCWRSVFRQFGRLDDIFASELSIWTIFRGAIAQVDAIFLPVESELVGPIIFTAFVGSIFPKFAESIIIMAMAMHRLLLEFRPKHNLTRMPDPTSTI